MNNLDQNILSKKEVDNRMQYWYSKYCNGVTREERQIYIKLYKAYSELNDLWLANHKY